jgi:hypothetical protein
MDHRFTSGQSYLSTYHTITSREPSSLVVHPHHRFADKNGDAKSTQTEQT